MADSDGSGGLAVGAAQHCTSARTVGCSTTRSAGGSSSDPVSAPAARRRLHPHMGRGFAAPRTARCTVLTASGLHHHGLCRRRRRTGSASLFTIENVGCAGSGAGAPPLGLQNQTNALDNRRCYLAGILDHSAATALVDIWQLGHPPRPALTSPLLRCCVVLQSNARSRGGGPMSGHRRSVHGQPPAPLSSHRGRANTTPPPPPCAPHRRRRRPADGFTGPTHPGKSAAARGPHLAAVAAAAALGLLWAAAV